MMVTTGNPQVPSTSPNRGKVEEEGEICNYNLNGFLLKDNE
jgi:hypothetical protein